MSKLNEFATYMYGRLQNNESEWMRIWFKFKWEHARRWEDEVRLRAHNLENGNSSLMKMWIAATKNERRIADLETRSPHVSTITIQRSFIFVLKLFPCFSVDEVIAARVLLTSHATSGEHLSIKEKLRTKRGKASDSKTSCKIYSLFIWKWKIHFFVCLSCVWVRSLRSSLILVSHALICKISNLLNTLRVHTRRSEADEMSKEWQMNWNLILKFVNNLHK